MFIHQLVTINPNASGGLIRSKRDQMAWDLLTQRLAGQKALVYFSDIDSDENRDATKLKKFFRYVLIPKILAATGEHSPDELEAHILKNFGWKDVPLKDYNFNMLYHLVSTTSNYFEL